jgi:tetratricopeptide (TPR) repeat protein
MRTTKIITKRILPGILWVILLVAGGFTCVQGSNVLVEKANKAYADGLYAEAADLYKKVAASGYEAPELYYNLGNACFKLNDFPAAILWYERARRLDPGNEDILFNLNVANSKIADKIEPVPEMFYVRWYFMLINRLPADGWALITIVCFLAAIAAATLYLLANRLFLRKIGFWSAATFLVLFLFALLFAFSASSRVRNVREAVIMTPTVTVKSSPDDKSVDLFVLHEGTKVRILDRIGTWNEIRIANGSVGWLQTGVMEQI